LYKLAVIVPFYKSIESSIEQWFINEFSTMCDLVLNDIQLIFVDDHSVVPLSFKIENKKLNFSLYKIDTDIEWNVGGAKNLGAHVSDCEKLLFMDADHSISEEKIKFLVDYKIKDNEHIIFMRGKVGSPGIFCTSRKRFSDLGGFDEQFSGHYGSEDKNYTLRHSHSGGFFTEIDGLISVRKKYHHHSLGRDVVRNKKIAGCTKRSDLFLNFKWHKVNLE
jgi:predicted glycosyltransferase involved in capsule biosynthesis